MNDLFQDFNLVMFDGTLVIPIMFKRLIIVVISTMALLYLYFIAQGTYQFNNIL